MKCPCCKVINSLDECLRHRSVTAAQAATRAWNAFSDMEPATLALMAFPCQKHGSEAGFMEFIDSANAKKREIVGRARAEQERIAAQSLDAIMRRAVWAVMGGGGR